MTHPAEREAERLRVIIETLAHSNPSMTMFEAAPTIFEIEKRTTELERQQVEPAPVAPTPFATVEHFELPNHNPETLANFVDICPAIRDLLPHKKINAIKELRARTGAGLKEAKDGIEHWVSSRSGGGASRTTFSPTPPPPATAWTASPTDIAAWITMTAQSDIVDMLDPAVRHGKIKAIKEVRLRYPGAVGLREAKEGVELYIDLHS